MNIIEAIKHEAVFRPFLEDEDGSLATWSPWLTALRVLYGLPVTSKRSRRLIRQCTGRDPDKLPKEGFRTALFLTGRRSGKSRISSIIGAHAAALAGLEKKLAKGEKGYVAIISASRSQSTTVKNYLLGIFDSSPMLRQEIESERKWEGFTLKNGVAISMHANDFRRVRGFTLVACIVDEICFFGVEEDSKVRSDTELIRALKPSLITTQGRLICISSPHAMRGWAYGQWKRHWGSDSSDVLVWKAPSRTMNSTLPQADIDAALKDDLAAARSEFFAEWRADLAIFIDPALVDSLVVPGRIENLPESGITYSAFVDLSGGRHDGSALSIVHREGRKIVVDVAELWKAGFINPYQVVGEMCDALKAWKISKVWGDNYSGDFAKAAFENHGVRYEKCDRPKSQLYSELLPILSSAEIELLDSPQLIKELCGLERRTRSGSKDVIDHCHGGHDDLINAVAGAAVMCTKKRHRSGGLW